MRAMPPHLYQPDDHELAQRHGEMQWVPRIQEALAKSRFTLFYQPIIPLGETGRAHGEVLLRLLNRDGDLISPSAFIPAAIARCSLAPVCSPGTWSWRSTAPRLMIRSADLRRCAA